MINYAAGVARFTSTNQNAVVGIHDDDAFLVRKDHGPYKAVKLVFTIDALPTDVGGFSYPIVAYGIPDGTVVIYGNSYSAISVENWHIGLTSTAGGFLYASVGWGPASTGIQFTVPLADIALGVPHTLEIGRPGPVAGTIIRGYWFDGVYKGPGLLSDAAFTDLQIGTYGGASIYGLESKLYFGGRVFPYPTTSSASFFGAVHEFYSIAGDVVALTPAMDMWMQVNYGVLLALSGRKVVTGVGSFTGLSFSPTSAYLFEITAGVGETLAYSVTVAPTGLPIDMALYDSLGNYISSPSAGVLGVSVTGPGTYYIAAASSSGVPITAAVSFAVASSPADTAWWLGSPGRGYGTRAMIEAAGPIELVDGVASALSQVREDKLTVYYFDVTEANTGLTFTTVGAGDSVLIVYDANGVVQGTDDDSGGLGLSKITLSGLATGRYFAGVSAYMGLITVGCKVKKARAVFDVIPAITDLFPDVLVPASNVFTVAEGAWVDSPVLHRGEAAIGVMHVQTPGLYMVMLGNYSPGYDSSVSWTRVSVYQKNGVDMASVPNAADVYSVVDSTVLVSAVNIMQPGGAPWVPVDVYLLVQELYNGNWDQFPDGVTVALRWGVPGKIGFGGGSGSGLSFDDYHNVRAIAKVSKDGLGEKPTSDSITAYGGHIGEQEVVRNRSLATLNTAMETSGDITVRGVILYGGNAVRRVVRLYDQVSGELVASTFSNVYGNFAFTGVASGDYYITANDLGARSSESIIEVVSV